MAAAAAFDYQCYNPNIRSDLQLLLFFIFAVVYFYLLFNLHRNHGTKIQGNIKKLLMYYTGLLLANLMVCAILVITNICIHRCVLQAIISLTQNFSWSTLGIIRNLRPMLSFPICQSMLMIFFLFLFVF